MSMIVARHARHASRSLQQGSFMLEALIAILIVALGILGTVGLYARSIQNVDDAKFRGEAALLANTLVGQMWVTDTKLANLTARFDSGSGGAEYVEFAALVAQRLPNSAARPPTVTVTAGPTPTSSNVLITIWWVNPGDKNDPMLPPNTMRQFDMNATVGSNTP
jgi:type IV pilus assembly protein PilV